jgi:hypothetical protein
MRLFLRYSLDVTDSAASSTGNGGASNEACAESRNSVGGQVTGVSLVTDLHCDVLWQTMGHSQLVPMANYV